MNKRKDLEQVEACVVAACYEALPTLFQAIRKHCDAASAMRIINEFDHAWETAMRSMCKEAEKKGGGS